MILLVNGHDFSAVQHPRKVHFGQGPRNRPRRASVVLSICGGGGELFSKVVSLGELRRERPLLFPFLADDNLLAILRARRQEIVIGLHKIRREEIEPVEPVVKTVNFLVRIIMGIDVALGPF